MVAAPEVLHASWLRCWRGLGASGDAHAVLRDLLARHAESWRHYHTLQHLGECIAWFERAGHLAAQPAEVEAALWFHDAVYAPPGRGDNEERSAQLARRLLGAAGVREPSLSRIEQLVLATRHTAEPEGADAQLLVDIDLAILGAAPARFAEYEAQIRAEYAFVPPADFRARRAAILRGFLQRPRLYATGLLSAALEAPARRNLEQALAGLAPG